MEYKRLLNIRELVKDNSYFLFGPRGTGKSFWVKKTMQDALVFSLLDDDVFERFSRRPKALEESVSDWSKVIVLDEIQKLPKLLDEVHRLIELHNAIFLLTGSSARKLKRGGANLLAGRAWEAHFFPLTWREITDFDLIKYINIGGLPRVYLSKKPRKELQAYIRIYLNEEIKAEALVRSYERFVNFLEAMAHANGREVNYQELARNSGVPARTLEGYLEVLVDTLLGYLLTPFTRTKKRKAITRAKLYFFDLGVVNYLKGIKDLTPGNSDFGDAFEHFVINEIAAYICYSEKEYKLTYWRTGDYEVDLVLAPTFGESTLQKKLIVIEIKSAEKIKDSFFRGLEVFQEEELPANYYLISRCKDQGTRNNVTYIYYEEFFTLLWDHEIL